MENQNYPGIEITFINQSYDASNSNVVIFQKNVAASFEETAVAWTMIENCGRNWKHKFNIALDMYVGAMDSWGNVTGLQLAQNGQKWDVVRSISGNVLSLDNSPAGSLTQIEIKNCLAVGSIDTQIYLSGKLLATKTGVSPQQKGVFEFRPTIWIGVVSDIEEGGIMNSAILADINTEISLLGIVRANLVMTGGGGLPFNFALVPTA